MQTKTGIRYQACPIQVVEVDPHLQCFPDFDHFFDLGLYMRLFNFICKALTSQQQQDVNVKLNSIQMPRGWNSFTLNLHFCFEKNETNDVYTQVVRPFPVFVQRLHWGWCVWLVRQHDKAARPFAEIISNQRKHHSCKFYLLVISIFCVNISLYFILFHLISFIFCSLFVYIFFIIYYM